MRIAYVGQNPWVSAAIAHSLERAELWEFAHRAAVDAELRSTADMIVLDGGEQPAVAHLAAEIAADGCRVVVLASDAARSHLRAIGDLPGVDLLDRGAGPDGLVELLLAVQLGDASEVSHREARLSEQERRVLALTAGGATAAQVAEELGITSGTVAAYLRRIRVKYRMAGRPARQKIDLYHRALEDGVIA
jgi:DNA-binding CsgD family transcriptional regulator